jgi:hypothetical protein
VAALVVGLLFTWYWVEEYYVVPSVVVRVLFSETANCSSRERALVAGVMKNRVRNSAFGNKPTLEAVVLQAGAFSCISDPGNLNWPKSRHPGRMTGVERAIWAQCVEFIESGVTAATGPSGRALVYYHDKRIRKPSSWDNAAWRAVREESTEHFVFYSIVPAGTLAGER